MTSAPALPYTVRRADVHDAPRLAIVAASTFSETFAEENDPRDMAAYSLTAFGEALQRRELGDPANVVFLAEQDAAPVGYAMLRGVAGPACVPDRNAVELARLYVVRHAIGSGVGAALMRACLGETAAQQRATIWLGVWERNARAIAFYRRWEFRDVGAQGFQLGADLQTDRVMARRVVERA